MWKKLPIFAITLYLALYCFDASANVINEKFLADEIVPDILDGPLPDLKPLTISYKSTLNVTLGNEFTPMQVREQPLVVWEAEEGVTYTLLMTDPDAPSRAEPIRREIRHWLTVNITGNDVSTGTTLWGYRGSGPPRDSGLHRYIFLLFKQVDGKIDFGLPEVPSDSSDGRAQTSTRQLISDFNLELVGGNYFQAQHDNANEAYNKFFEAEIVPDILDGPLPDLKSVTVSYPTQLTVNYGNELKPSEVKTQPTVAWEVEEGAVYTLLMTDPDAPSRAAPTVREYRHWLTVNITGNDVTTGDVIYDYQGSGPPIDTGLHRYVFLVFKQRDGKIDFELPHVSNDASDGRLNTNTRDLISKHNLDLVAGNYFQAQFENGSKTVSANLFLLATLATVLIYSKLRSM